MSMQAASARTGAVSRALAQDRLGVPAVLAFILAGVAPLTVAAGLIPTAYAVTGLTGIPAAFLVIAVVLAVFATGYMAMSRNIVNAGACYAFIAQGLGRATGVAAALIALAAYSCLQIALYGMLGPAAASQAADRLGVHAAWWAWALGTWAVITVLGLLRVDITGRVLGTLTAIEIAVILAETAAGLAHPAGRHLSFATLSPSALTSGGLGTAGVLAVIAFFARNPRGESAWSRLVAPALAAILLTGLAVLAVLHYGTLLGVPPGAAAAWALPASYAVLAAAGLAWGLVIKIRRPGVYDGIGLGAHATSVPTRPADFGARP